MFDVVLLKRGFHFDCLEYYSIVFLFMDQIPDLFLDIIHILWKIITGLINIFLEFFKRDFLGLKNDIHEFLANLQLFHHGEIVFLEKFLASQNCLLGVSKIRFFFLQHILQQILEHFPRVLPDLLQFSHFFIVVEPSYVILCKIPGWVDRHLNVFLIFKGKIWI